MLCTVFVFQSLTVSASFFVVLILPVCLNFLFLFRVNVSTDCLSHVRVGTFCLALVSVRIVCLNVQDFPSVSSLCL